MAANQKRREASQKKKEKIMQTTINLLLEKGTTYSTSTTDICVAARITRPTLYHYFGSKRKLLLSVHMFSIKNDLRPYLEKAASIDNPVDRLSFMIRTFTKDIICRHPELRILIHDSLTMKDKYFKEVRQEWRKHYLLLKETIAQLKSEGRIETEMKPSWAALFILGILTWTTYWFEYSRKGEEGDIADAALQLVRHGLGFKEIGSK